MKCPKCHNPMRHATCDGKTGFVCLRCNFVVTGATESEAKGATPPRVPRKATGGSPALLEPTSRTPSDGEALFAAEWAERYPELRFETEYMFSLHRNWCIDFAFVPARVAVEYEGGGSYGHGRKNRYDSDLAKYNALSAEGWLLFRCTKATLATDTERFCRMVAMAIQKRLGGAG